MSIKETVVSTRTNVIHFILSILMAAVGVALVIGSGGGAATGGEPPTGPSITAQPASVTVTEGQTATFAVVSTGTAPLSYQWRRNNVDIVGATSASYSVGTPGLSDSGAQFSVVVSNAAANATSNVATLTVVAATPSVTWVVSTIAGTSGLLGPKGVVIDSAGALYVSDSANSVILKITSAGTVSTFAGSELQIGGVDGTGAAARFFGPAGLAIDTDGNIYVADSFNHAIRKITSAGVVTTLAGLAGSPGSADGIGSAARFSNPAGVTIDGDRNVYVADTLNQTIRKITPGGVVTTLAGLAGFPSISDGTGSAARFVRPIGMATDSNGHIYVADSGNQKIRKITSAGVVTTIAGLSSIPGSTDGVGTAARFFDPRGVATDSAKNVYVADSLNYTIRRIAPTGVVTTIAGLAGVSGSADGTGTAARFNLPYSLTTDGAGNIYLADYGNNRIRKLTPQQPSVPPAAVSCAGLRSGKYRFIHPHEAATNPASVVRLMTVDATAMTVTDDSAPGAPAVAITPDATRGCLFTIPLAFGTGTWLVSPSGLSFLRQLNASGQTVVSLIVPEQTIAASELAGTWNFYTHHRMNIPLNGNSGTAVIDAAGVNTSGADCIGLTACVPWSSQGSRFGSFVADAGGGFSTAGPVTSRAFAFRNATGALSLYVVTPSTGSLTFATLQAALNLPTVGTALKFWGFNILENSEIVSALSTNAFTITAVDAVAQTYTRTRVADGSINVFKINEPRSGLRHRAATTNPNTLGIINMPLSGTGVSLTLAVNPPSPSVSFFEFTIDAP